ncbi:adenosylcobinamide-GDP ribazoletransferase, partial [Kitasatospora sp. NPDC036755]|uniref:adenosylcobinamide-GDP ribazoletransferase n=1 Tax=Kitasatospora sp. NPDC036755 TaxID=3154600 RepID=UPI0033D48C5E
PVGAAAATAVAALALAAAGLSDGWSALRLPLAVALGTGCARLLLGRCVRRFGGITGDVLGATAETAATASLFALALLG